MRIPEIEEVLGMFVRAFAEVIGHITNGFCFGIGFWFALYRIVEIIAKDR